MTSERTGIQGKLFAHELVLQIGLETGRRTILRRRRGSGQISAMERSNRVSRWWNEQAVEPFLLGALIWKENQGASMARDAQLSVETDSLAMSMAQTEDSLRQTFRTARGMAISAIDLAQRLKNESRIIENRLGNSSWMKRYLLWSVKLLTEEYSLNKKKACAIIDFTQAQGYLL